MLPIKPTRIVPPEYSIHDYGLMLADPRADRYARAMRATIRPGHVVMDLGAGTGIWAVLACTLGARRVFAIEPGDVIGLARDIARANGVSDRITFVQQRSTDFIPDEPVDVVVADVRGVLPMAGSSLETMRDARRLLSATGVLIPQRDTLWVAVVRAEQAYRLVAGPWESACFGLDFSLARRQAVNTWRKARFADSDLLSAATQWATIDYRTLADSSVAGEARLPIVSPGEAHGLAIWFESELTGDVQLSNRPGSEALIYGQAFFPWLAPVQLGAGDTVTVALRARFTGSGYLFRWQTSIADDTGRERARFDQSTFDGLPLSVESLRAQESSS